MTNDGHHIVLNKIKNDSFSLGLFFLYVALTVFEVGSSITLVINSSSSFSSRMLTILDFQALELEAPTSLSSTLTKKEAML
jgi:hypothetical protein